MLLKFEPIALEKVWGGNNLKKTYKIDKENIGEIWGISAHESYSNKIINTRFAGKTLRELFIKEKYLFGNLSVQEFPVLFKVIDAADDLSVQVHPQDEYALKHESSHGKDECWYILETHSKNTEIIIGHHAKTKAELTHMIENNQYESLLNRFKIKPKDYFYIPSGKVHAICKNTTLLEVSQSSNVTYRLYDYNRLDKGKLRELHVEKSLDVILVPDTELKRVHDDKYFYFEVFDSKEDKEYKADVYGDYFYCIKGSGEINAEEVKAGDFFMISSETVYQVKGSLKLARVRIKA